MNPKSDYEKQFDADTIEAASRFISRIEKQIIRKQFLPNTADKFPVEKAAESFDHYLQTNEFKKLIQDNGN
ncbi:MAG: hypothetical protein OEV78_04070 [Spirochaetia bacterium]|nr:hypothetical protein [Spirochaetia bacterium]